MSNWIILINLDKKTISIEIIRFCQCFEQMASFLIFKYQPPNRNRFFVQPLIEPFITRGPVMKNRYNIFGSAQVSNNTKFEENARNLIVFLSGLFWP